MNRLLLFEQKTEDRELVGFGAIYLCSFSAFGIFHLDVFSIFSIALPYFIERFKI